MSFPSQSAQFMIRASIVTILGAGIVSCSENKSAQCAKLIGVANQAVNSIETVTAPVGSNGSSNNIEALNKIITVADDTNKAMKDLNLTDPKLQEFRGRFTTMYTATSTATRDLVAAANNKDAAASQKAYEALKTSTSQESPLVDEVNGYCSTGG
jgi:oligoendopeptidase F